MLQITVHEKTMGAKVLLQDFELLLHDGEKLGFIGRNGTGKTTLLRLLTGQDADMDGSLVRSKHVSIMATSQEHHEAKGVSTLDYVSSKLPKFASLHHIISTYPEHMGTNMKKMEVYSDALNEFSDLGYYDVENSLERLFDAYQLPKELLNRDFSSLSGGQKRLAELIAIQLAQPQIALLDEPTNHMDYAAKEAFIDWLKSTSSAVLVISHDRDVLQVVDRIVELKDRTSYSYSGNYQSYLSQNANKTTNAIHAFETEQKRIANIKEQIEYAKARAPGYKGKAGKNPWIVMRDRLEKELKAILETHERPSFWIDQTSAQQLKPDQAANYHKFKAKNIRLQTSKTDDGHSSLLTVHNLSLGYNNSPLFNGCSFTLSSNERLHIVGRNGAGKTTLVRAIIEAAAGKLPGTLIGNGTIEHASRLRLSVYEQEIGHELLDCTLYDAIEALYRSKNVPVNEQVILKDMGNYLFDPLTDRDILVKNLSGGQKARLQLIRLLVGSPNLLILDEPTNHLDLPSIEELETALKKYTGAIIYISHDSYFASALGGKTLTINA